MENEPKREIFKTMPCASVERLIAELEAEGWEYDYSFRTRIPESWNDVCGRVKKMKTDGFWEPVLVQGQDEAERKDGVAYIYKRKTEQFNKFEKDMGYTK